jgi:hypothetical protein
VLDEKLYFQVFNLPASQTITLLKCTAGITSPMSQRPTTIRCPHWHRRSTIRRSDNPEMTAAQTPRSRSLMAHRRS